MDSGRRILFVAQRLSDYVEMRRAAVSLKQYGYKCIMLFCGVDSAVHDNLVIQEIDNSINRGELDDKIIFSRPVIADNIIQRIMRVGIGRTISREKYGTKKTKYYVIRIFDKILKVIDRVFFSSYRTVPMIYKMNYGFFKQIIKEHQINLIILPEDTVGSITPLIIKAGHFLKVPSLILPYTISNQTETFQSLKERNELSIYKNLLNWILGVLFKAWVMKDKEHATLRLPAPYLIAHLVTRSSPPDPWMMNSGYANVIAIENEQMFEYYRKSGIPASKMKITGACYDDELAGYYLDKENQRARIYKQLNIESNKPLFLIGGFPNQIIDNPPGFDFSDAEDAVNFITECLEPFKKDYEIIFRSHPNYLALAELFAKKSITVASIDTAQLVAVSDVYLAFASATIRWAISCGIPTINYDMFYYNFSDYKHVNGVLNVCTKDEFKTAVNRMNNPDEYNKLLSHLELEKKQWGNLDGQSVARINTLMKELVQLKKVRRKAS